MNTLAELSISLHSRIFLKTKLVRYVGGTLLVYVNVFVYSLDT
jgi:hypothetical protein